MLILERHVGERIHIGDDIVIEVRRVSESRVRIGVEAPKDATVLRAELKEPRNEPAE